MRSEFAPRMEYGRTQPNLHVTSAGVHARGGPVQLTCSGPVVWDCTQDRAVTSFTVSAGETVELRHHYQASFTPPPPPGRPRDTVGATMEDTAAAWRSWAAQHTSYDGAYPAEVRRSSIVLQGLTCIAGRLFRRRSC